MTMLKKHIPKTARDYSAIIKGFKDKKILVLGDAMIDRYTFGRVSKLSPEAPIPVVEKTGERCALGGAGNVAANCASLGARVSFAGMAGKDKNRDLMLKLLRESGIKVAALYAHPTKPTVEKHRIIAGDSHQLVRLDIENCAPLRAEEEQQLFRQIKPFIVRCDAVILSDYAKGFFSEAFTRAIMQTAKKYGKLVLADFKPSRKDFFLGSDIISPNLHEGQVMTGFQDPEQVGLQLVAYFDSHVVLTQGGEGMSVFRHGGAKSYYIPGKKIEIFDVTGAGDTAIAVLTLGLVSGLEIEEAATLANEAAAIVVQKPFTATVSSKELIAVYNRHKSGG